MPDVSHHAAILQGLEKGTYQTLGVTIGSHTITPGQKIPKAGRIPEYFTPHTPNQSPDTQPTPSLSAPPGLAEGTYAVISLDLDAPFSSWNVLSPIAHWVQTGFRIDQQSASLKSDDPPLCPWLPAGPPPGAAPHRYVFFLYAQKPGEALPLSTEPLGRMQRMRFDLDAMAGRLGLGGIVAVNYFVSN
ncbi:YbhB/YbcL family Raf kinase inhibitor-like protein [Aspergillus lucknowensis]|uniref:Phosphatidylethanolamine-binding protein n=1 Tax=Aspergillus lucknowensis TaxID=176173 RepID=A0ABR4LX07_9EURO